MADIEVPETEAIDEATADAEELHVADDVPEADAIEQAQAVATATRRDYPTIRDDVPEADALEQAYEVGLDDDDRG